MRRKRRNSQHNEPPENHDRWLVSYADFITLLFAFFVVMYAISSVNAGKYRVLSDSLVSAFRTKDPGQSQTSDLYPAIVELPIPTESNPIQATAQPIVDELNKKRQVKQIRMRRMAKDIMQALAPLVEDGSVRVTQSDRGITVEINASVLFSPGEAQLAENSSTTLRAVAAVVKNHEQEIHIEGHTDNLPINTLHYPSNWELSTARASRVIRLFVNNGVDASQLTALGYGEHQPVALNDTPEGRARNRRVMITIMSNEPEQITEIPVELVSDIEGDAVR